jgi:hypothetical protein
VNTPRRDPGVQILHVPDCPLVERLRLLLEECMAEIGTNERVNVLVGDYPSPTLLIDGIDVASGMPLRDGASCRLDLPTRTQILDALTGGREGRRSRGAD